MSGPKTSKKPKLFPLKPAAGTKDRRDMLDQLHQHPRGAYSQHGLFNIQELRS